MDFIDTFAKRSFAFNQIPDLKGKVAIITGSNTGVGALLKLRCYISDTHLRL